MRRGRINNNIKKEKSNEKRNNLKRSLKIVNEHNERINKERENRKNEKANSYQYNNAYKKIKHVIFSLIVVVIIIIVLLFLYFAPLIGISINKNVGIEEDKKIDIVSTDSDIYDTYCSDLLIYNNQKVATYNSRGKKNWEYNISGQFTPKIYLKDKFMAISNNSSGKIYLFENKKEILDTQIDGKIDEIFLDSDGNMVVEYSTSGYKKILGVYSKKGKNLYNAYLSSDAIINIKMINNAKQLIVLQTDTSSFKVGINLFMIDGTKADDVKKVTTLNNNFIYNLTIQGRNIIMLLDDKIIKCNMDTGDLQTISSYDSTQIVFMALATNYYTSISKELATDSKDNTYSITSSRFDNTKISNININGSPKLLKNSNVVNYLIYQDYIQIVNKWGVEIKKFPIDFPPQNAIIFNNGRTIALIYTDKIYVVNI